MTEVLVDLDPDIRRASRLVAFQWPGVVDEHDMVHDIYLHLLERPNEVDKLRRMSDEKARYNIIVKIGHRIASQERKDYSYFTGNYRYSVKEVRALLSGGALWEDETSPPVHRPTDEEYQRPVAGKSRPPVPAAVTDLRQAMSLLRERHLRYAEAICTRYLHDLTPDTSLGRTVLSRALGALAEEMNRVHRTKFATRDDGLGTRRPVTAEKARWISTQDWKGADLDYEASR